MSNQNFEKRLMGLDINLRAELASKLILSLDDLSEAEIEKLWAEESIRREAELIKGKVKAIPADKVFKKAVNRFK